MHHCEFCKWSCSLSFPQWTDEFENKLQEEIKNNEDDTYRYAPFFVRFFWQHKKIEFEANQRRAETFIECRRFPEFVERNKGDYCGEYSQSKTLWD